MVKSCKIEYARWLTCGIAVAPQLLFLKQGGEMLFMPPEFNQGGIGMMITYSELIATVALVVSVARLVLDVVKYHNEHKKK